jgi:omega-amidase
MRVLVVQNRVKRTDKLENLFFAMKETRKHLIERPADLIVFPEMFCCPYSPQHFVAAAEEMPDVGVRPKYEKNSVSHALSSFAQEQQTLVVAGSIPEKKGEVIYNTTLFFDIEGTVVGKYRKYHLFDVDIKATDKTPAIKVRESETFTRGDLGTCWVDCGPFGKIGLGICFDLRFPELFMSMSQEAGGLRMIVVPAAFATRTGETHQRLLARARAIDTQSFVIVASSARSLDVKDFQVYGHSMVVSPWGEVIKELDEHPGVIDLEIPIDQADEVKKQIPLKRRFAVTEIKSNDLR